MKNVVLCNKHSGFAISMLSTSPTYEGHYPEAFLTRMKNMLGTEYDLFVESLRQPSPISVRLNPFKRISKFDEEEKVTWCENGKYLRERPSFTFDPLFRAGTYYVQEASSMFIEQIWKQVNHENKTVRVLDMCAAPGGKSTHLLSLMNEESLLVSNEVIPNRNKILRENITKWGTANCIVSQNKPEDFSRLENYFDIVLVDAPCSGEGLFRKDKNAIGEWSEKNVAMCSLRQKEILKHAVQCLKPDGFLIYSTCTFEEEENDLNVEQLRDTNYELSITNYEIPIANYELREQPSVVRTKSGFQFFPHKVKGEGFYISVLKKESGHERQGTRDEKRKTPGNGHRIPDNYLQHSENFIEHSKNDLCFAIPKQHYADFLFLEKQLYIRHAGIFLGTMKGKNFLPSHDLALSIHINKNLPAIELNYEQAISYLRCETPTIKTNLRGWCLVKYKNQNLGWIKILEGRINNYFPKELRILKQA